MPLPNLNKRCTARCRSRGGARCLNPAAFGCKTCAYHGGRPRSTVRTGKDHWNHKHGLATIQCRAEEKQELRELRELENLLNELKLI
jgi:hypothetical protein